ncbi:hypothetical protein [Serratia rubidaea]|uniref:hypothetical protein n=1 Tax=Serratia rubidaea TaxID=61652 RepID=UPI0024328874|nr:hypothetical protein [Serratia rubidaea]MCR0997872.1 hypothetical protein [Serratia rubidaea]
MKKILGSVLHGLVAVKNGETVADNYVKLQEGWSVYSQHIQADGSVKVALLYAVLFFDLTEQKYYSKTQAGKVRLLENDESGYSKLVVRKPFEFYKPNDIVDVEDSWPFPAFYPTIMAERPIG